MEGAPSSRSLRPPLVGLLLLVLLGWGVVTPLLAEEGGSTPGVELVVHARTVRVATLRPAADPADLLALPEFVPAAPIIVGGRLVEVRVRGTAPPLARSAHPDARPRAPPAS